MIELWAPSGVTLQGFIRAIIAGVTLAAILFFAIVCSGCATQPPKQIVQYKTVEVPTFIRAPIPAQYVQDVTVVEPAPACGKLYCNGQVASLIDDYRAALRQSNLDKAALRSLQPTETPSQ